MRAAVIQRTALGFEEEYIPRAVNWLREQRWEDEVESWTPDEDEKQVKAALAWIPPTMSHAVWCQGKQYSVPDAGFAAWWSAYPRQLNIDEAWTEWQGLDPDDELRAQLLAELERDKRSDVWARDRRRIPYPHVWLWRESQKRRS